MSGIPKLTLNANETAAALGVSRSKVYELFKIEGFPAMRLGGRVMVNASKLSDWVDKQTPGYEAEKTAPDAANIESGKTSRNG